MVDHEIIRQIVIILLFVWSIVNLAYYAFVEKSKYTWYYVASFIIALMYQVAFYAIVLLDRLSITSKPYDNYFTELSYKRNLLFAILAVIVTVDMVLKLRRNHNNVNYDDMDLEENL